MFIIIIIKGIYIAQVRKGHKCAIKWCYHHARVHPVHLMNADCGRQPSDQANGLCNKCIAVRKVATPLRELTCHTG